MTVSKSVDEFNILEVVLKPQIMFESKAQADEKAQHTSSM
jgi:hypothetical protein